MGRPRQAIEGKYFKPVMKGYRMHCCDCGLVHVIDFKVIHHGRGHKVLLRAKRDNRATNRIRARKGIKL